jgi:hypothetical protein
VWVNKTASLVLQQTYPHHAIFIALQKRQALQVALHQVLTSKLPQLLPQQQRPLLLPRYLSQEMRLVNWSG